MRLIHTTSLKLVEFSEDDIPYSKYAILSHRWTDDEVTLKEYRKILKRKSAGYRKITKACELARARNREYIWIDTVCIDKRSSAELSEAINSMYRWYHLSAECYVHLHDVSVSSSSSNQTDQPQTLLDKVRQSSWFTRGWTLQELLAPRHLHFFTTDWQPLGDRQDDTIAMIVSSITGIQVYDLNNFSPLQSSVARKMSWASRRKTTRPEDLAYCLLGLFDVNMPLLYGEGGQKAFMRLQLEIIKKSDDKSIFAWGWDFHVGLAWHGLLAPSPEPFEGCGDIINVQDEECEENKFPYEMTNRGLSFRSNAELILGEGSLERYMIDLDCTRLDRENGGEAPKRWKCYLILEPVTQGSKMFRRRHIARGGLGGPNIEKRYPRDRRKDVGMMHFYIQQAGL